MRRVTKTYPEVRHLMRPGDIIAFGGTGELSIQIKSLTKAPVSHIGIVRHTQMVDDDDDGRFFNEIIESTSLEDFIGVSVSQLSSRLKYYKGETWWLPLSSDSRKKLELPVFFNWLYSQEGKPYDFFQAIQSGLDPEKIHPWLGLLTTAKEDFSKQFCSELAAGALEEGGVLPSINASEVTPIDLCRMAIYADTYYQLRGNDLEISRFNMVPAESFA